MHGQGNTVSSLLGLKWPWPAPVLQPGQLSSPPPCPEASPASLCHSMGCISHLSQIWRLAGFGRESLCQLHTSDSTLCKVSCVSICSLEGQEAARREANSVSSERCSARRNGSVILHSLTSPPQTSENHQPQLSCWGGGEFSLPWTHVELPG